MQTARGGNRTEYRPVPTSVRKPTGLPPPWKLAFLNSYAPKTKPGSDQRFFAHHQFIIRPQKYYLVHGRPGKLRLRYGLNRRTLEISMEHIHKESSITQLSKEKKVWNSINQISHYILKNNLIANIQNLFDRYLGFVI